jgi:hypothetical protein
MWLCDVPENKSGAGWHSGYNWSKSELKDVWGAIDVEAHAKDWDGYDRIRREEMGDEPHW